MTGAKTAQAAKRSIFSPGMLSFVAREDCLYLQTSKSEERIQTAEQHFGTARSDSHNFGTDMCSNSKKLLTSASAVSRSRAISAALRSTDFITGGESNLILILFKNFALVDWRSWLI